MNQTFEKQLCSEREGQEGRRRERALEKLDKVEQRGGSLLGMKGPLSNQPRLAGTEQRAAKKAPGCGSL